MEYRTFNIDRVVSGKGGEKVVVLVNETDPADRIEAAAGIFPTEPSPGMTVRIYEDGRMEEDPEASLKRKKRIRSLMNDLFE